MLGGGEMERIAVEVEEKLGATLNDMIQGLAVKDSKGGQTVGQQAARSQQAAGDDEGRPRIGLIWQSMMVVTLFACPTLMSGSRIVGAQNVSYRMGFSLLSISLSSGLLWLVSDPDNKGA